MVKFSFIALASALAATANAANTGRPVRKTIKLGNRQLRRGEPATEALLKKAVPYKKKSSINKNNARRLDGEVEFDGSYSLKFSQCIDAKTYDEDLFDEDMVAYVQAGQVVSAKSYVLFHVCQGDNCYYESEEDIYMVDLPTYLTNVALYHANKRNDYCQACEEFEDVCNVEEEEEEAAEDEEEEADDAEEEEGEDEEGEQEEDNNEEEEDDKEDEDEEEDDKDEEEEEDDKDEEDEEDDKDDEDENEGEDRKLKKKDRKLISRKLANKEYIDCDQCEAYECYVDEEDMDDGYVRREELDESVSEWIQDLAECKESGVQWNGLDLYLGAMCSPYGDGVELAVFVNEECTMYTNQKAFQYVWNPNNENEDGVNYLTYAEEFIKSAFSEVTPCLQQEFADPNEEDDGNDDEEEEEYEMNEYCQGVMEEDIADFNNCAPDENNQDEENDDQYNWYTYDMKDADDIDEVCYAINQMEGEYNHLYDEEMSGTWYDRNKKGDIVTQDSSGGVPSLSPEIIAVIVGVAVVVLGGAAFLMRPKKQAVDNNEPVYQGGTML